MSQLRCRLRIRLYQLLAPSQLSNGLGSHQRGLDVAAAIRSDARIAATPIVFLTSVDNGVSPEEIRRLRIHKNLMKPARSSYLFDAIIAAIAANRNAGETMVLPQALDHEEPSAPESDSTRPLQRSAPRPTIFEEDAPKPAARFADNDAPAQNSDSRETAGLAREAPVRPAPAPHNAAPSDFALDILIAEDNEAVIKIVGKYRSTALRHLPRTHKIYVNWLLRN